MNYHDFERLADQPGPKDRMNLREFHRRITFTPTCWEFDSFRFKSTAPAVFSYRVFIGHVRRDEGVGASCKNPKCVNPGHLYTEKARPAKTHCSRGHKYTETNTYTTPEGVRQCRKCRKLYWETTAQRAEERKRLLEDSCQSNL